MLGLKVHGYKAMFCGCCPPMGGGEGEGGGGQSRFLAHSHGRPILFNLENLTWPTSCLPPPHCLIKHQARKTPVSQPRAPTFCISQGPTCENHTAWRDSPTRMLTSLFFVNRFPSALFTTPRIVQEYCHPPRSAFYYVVFNGMQFSTGSVYMYIIVSMYKGVPTGWVLSSSTVLYSTLQEIVPLLPLLLNVGCVSLIRCQIVLLKENLPYFHRDYSRKTNWLYIEINIQTTEATLKSTLKKQWDSNQKQCDANFVRVSL
jgi:hypothetical protein